MGHNYNTPLQEDWKDRLEDQFSTAYGTCANKPHSEIWTADHSSRQSSSSKFVSYIPKDIEPNLARFLLPVILIVKYTSVEQYVFIGHLQQVLLTVFGIF